MKAALAFNKLELKLTVVQLFSEMHHFIQLSMNWNFAQAKILDATRRRSVMKRMSGNGPDWK